MTFSQSAIKALLAHSFEESCNAAKLSWGQCTIAFILFHFAFFFCSHVRKPIVWRFPCADFKTKGRACLPQWWIGDPLLGLRNKCFICRTNPRTLSKQKQVLHHSVKSQGIVWRRRKGSELQQTIMKGHGTQSGSASQLPKMLPLSPPTPPHLAPFIPMSPLNRTPLVLITTSSSDGKSIRNHHWDRSPLFGLCAALTSSLLLSHNLRCE